MQKTTLFTLILGCQLTFSTDLLAASLYPQPLTPQYETGDEQLTCSELDLLITKLSSQTYSSKPGFYGDPYHGASIWSGAIWAPGAWSYLAYSGVAEYTEQDRMQDAQNRIEALRYQKARRRCHE
jgi:hypothetical protein